MVILAGWAGVSVGFVLGAVWARAVRRLRESSAPIPDERAPTRGRRRAPEAVVGRA